MDGEPLEARGETYGTVDAEKEQLGEDTRRTEGEVEFLGVEIDTGGESVLPWRIDVAQKVALRSVRSFKGSGVDGRGLGVGEGGRAVSPSGCPWLPTTTSMGNSWRTATVAPAAGVAGAFLVTIFLSRCGGVSPPA